MRCLTSGLHKGQQAKGACLKTLYRIIRCQTCRQLLMKRMKPSSTKLILHAILCKQTIISINNLPVSDGSCLCLRVPILQGTKYPLQSGHSSCIMDDQTCLWEAACTCATCGRCAGFQDILVLIAADQSLL